MWGEKIQASCLHLFTLHLFASLIRRSSDHGESDSMGRGVGSGAARTPPCPPRNPLILLSPFPCHGADKAAPSEVKRIP
jgi:hypothetical protein